VAKFSGALHSRIACHGVSGTKGRGPVCAVYYATEKPAKLQTQSSSIPKCSQANLPHNTTWAHKQPCALIAAILYCAGVSGTEGRGPVCAVYYATEKPAILQTQYSGIHKCPHATLQHITTWAHKQPCALIAWTCGARCGGCLLRVPNTEHCYPSDQFSTP
jgi:hypothetical protein